MLYTDGNVIFDGRSHQEIGSGVGGNPSSTEAALIVPVPGGDPTNDFYVFGNTANTSGEINYTRVDIQQASIDPVTELPSEINVGVRVYSHQLGDCRDSELLGPIGRQDRKDLVDSVQITGGTTTKVQLIGSEEGILRGEIQ